MQKGRARAQPAPPAPLPATPRTHHPRTHAHPPAYPAYPAAVPAHLLLLCFGVSPLRGHLGGPPGRALRRSGTSSRRRRRRSEGRCPLCSPLGTECPRTRTQWRRRRRQRRPRRLRGASFRRANDPPETMKRPCTLRPAHRTLASSTRDTASPSCADPHHLMRVHSLSLSPG